VGETILFPYFFDVCRKLPALRWRKNAIIGPGFLPECALKEKMAGEAAI